MAKMQSDIVISGGGATGMALALGLMQSTDFNVTLIDPAPPGEASEGFDARSVALASHSVDVLKHLGIANLEDISCPIHTIQVSDQGHLGQCVLSSDEFGVPALGRVVELQALGQALHGALKAYGGERLTLRFGDAVTSIEQHARHLSLQTGQGDEIDTALLCVAEGGRSPSREMIGLSAQQQSYEQVAVIANVALDRPHQHLACERFTSGGPIALLPMTDVDNTLSGTRCSLVWTTTAEQAEHLLALSKPDFNAALQAAFGYRMGLFVDCGERHAYPLSLIKATDFTAHRAVLLGNAAQSLHPIAGQGLNLALRDVEDLLSAFNQTNSTSLEQPFPLLQRYRELRLSDKSRVIGLTDTLVRVFSNQFLPFVVGRNLGLLAMQHSKHFKTQFTAQAMGMRA